MVRLLYFRQPGNGVGEPILSKDKSYCSSFVHTGNFRSRLYRAAIWRAGVWQAWRFDRKEIYFSAHPHHHGRINLCNWTSSRLSKHRICCAFAGPAVKIIAGFGIGRRIWRSCNLCSGTFTRTSSWLLHQLDSNYCNAWPLSFVGCYSHHQA